MVTDNKKKQINEFAEYVAGNFSVDNVTQLHDICNFESVSYYFDGYEDAFDGMFVIDENDYHIHINTDRGNHQTAKRGRFTFAHELGHYFLDDHRLGLKHGKVSPHPSFHGLNQKNAMEEEADYFASCLLMPAIKFHSFSGKCGRRFSLDTILKLSEAFQASVLSTTIRFADFGTHEIMAVFSRNNQAEWYVKSKDFPNWPFRFKVGSLLPPTTVSGEFFSKRDRKYTGIEKVSADDWFYPKDVRGNRQMYEQCYYSDAYGFVVSILWFD